MDQEIKRQIEQAKKKDFAEEFANIAFTRVDSGYMNKEDFIKGLFLSFLFIYSLELFIQFIFFFKKTISLAGVEHEWIRDFFSLQAIFKRNKFLRFSQY